MKSHPKTKNWLVVKDFLMIFLPLAILLSLITGLVYYNEVKNYRTILREKELIYGKQLSESIVIEFKTVLSSLIFLSEQHELQRLLDGEESEKTDLARFFLSFSKRMGLFDQIRFLDEYGLEIVRVNFNNNNPDIVPENQLQSKSKQYYFKNTFRLQRGEVYLSPLDLNIEKGKVEQPPKPVIRFGTPIFDRKGRKRGIIILNYLGAKLLSNFDRFSTFTLADLMLLNSQGYWLKGPDHKKDWGFMYETQKKLTFGNAYPEAWLKITNSHSGQFLNASGLFTFTTIYPLTESSKPFISLNKDYRLNQVLLDDTTYYWKIVSHVTPEQLKAGTQNKLKAFILIDAMIIFVLAIAIFAFCRARILRKQSESELFKLTKAIEANPIGVIIFDPAWTIEYVNPKVTELTGYQASELIGTHPRTLDSDDYLSRFFQEMWDALQSGNDWSREMLLKKKTGTLFWDSTSISPIVDPNGQITHIVVTLEDISERKKNEAELKKLSLAIEQSPISVVITDTAGSIEYVNPRFSKVTGYSFEETLGQDLRFLKSDKNSADLYKDLWDTIMLGREWRGEIINRKKNGDTFWESMSISPIRDSLDQITHFVSVREDITERKNTEEDLAERIKELDQARLDMLNIMEDLEDSKKKAEAATQAKSDFLANMSHEIRTPLNAIMGMTHLCAQTDVTPQQNNYLSQINASTNSLLGIINDVLDLTRIEDGKLVMKMVDFDLEDVFNKVTTLVLTKAQKKELKFLIQVSPGIPRFLIGDSKRLGQVLTNLADNAVKFTNEGEVVISVEPVREKADVIDLQFSVRDTGIGLTKEQIGKLFQPFSQVDASLTRKYGGTGLGLNISKHLVEMLNGCIRVESTPGAGSAFIFTASFKRQTEKEEQLLRPSADLTGKQTAGQKIKPQRSENEIKEILPNPTGIDTVSGLARIGGNIKLYQDLLFKFYRDNQKVTKHIDQALSKNDLASAQRKVNTIKGLSGTIGALDLQSAAAKLTFTVEQNSSDDIQDELALFNKELGIVIGGLKEFAESYELPALENTEKAEGLPTILQELLPKLETHLQKREPKPSKDIMAEIKSYVWSDNISQSIDQLSVSIDKYKFEEAQQVIIKLFDIINDKNESKYYEQS